MKSEQDRATGKMSYDKPTAIDLGPTAPVVGASCATGRDIGRGYCELQGNSADRDCKDGSIPGGVCEDGSGYNSATLTGNEPVARG